MSFSLALGLVSAYSLTLAAIIAVVKYKGLLKTYRPFLYFIWAGLANELATELMAYNGRAISINNNIYVMVESLLLLWLFKNWNPKTKRDYRFEILAVVFVTTWVLESFVFRSLKESSSYFRVLYTLSFVFFSIDTINYVIMTERKSLFQNAKFIIAAGFLVYFSFKALIEIFFAIKLNVTDSFYNSLFNILVIINLLVNLIYALATLWIPSKRKFTLAYL
ncbi:MAG: hypothetical protein JWQ96_995 [Segetibacter sp.]|nr:hypothetical protein [Segetibacter sp.]